MDTLDAFRLALVFLHLLLCVFALQRVLQTDWRVLRGRTLALELDATHALLVMLLAGLWITGLALVAIELRGDFAAIADKPKLIAKLATVGVLTLNAAYLRSYCFPRLRRGKALSGLTLRAVLMGGAFSTASWLMAAFFGVARPLQSWTPGACLALYGAVLGAAVLVALALPAIAARSAGFARALPLLRGAGDAPWAARSAPMRTGAQRWSDPHRPPIRAQ